MATVRHHRFVVVLIVLIVLVVFVVVMASIVAQIVDVVTVVTVGEVMVAVTLLVLVLLKLLVVLMLLVLLLLQLLQLMLMRLLSGLLLGGCLLLSDGRLLLHLMLEHQRIVLATVAAAAGRSTDAANAATCRTIARATAHIRTVGTVQRHEVPIELLLQLLDALLLVQLHECMRMLMEQRIVKATGRRGQLPLLVRRLLLVEIAIARRSAAVHRIAAVAVAAVAVRAFALHLNAAEWRGAAGLEQRRRGRRFGEVEGLTGE